MNKSNSKYFSTALRMNEALISLLEKKDMEYISVKEICEKAGVNRSTFYLHYETISDLIAETTETVNNRFMTIRMYPGNRTATPIEFDTDGLPTKYKDCKVNLVDCGVME